VLTLERERERERERGGYVSDGAQFLSVNSNTLQQEFGPIYVLISINFCHANRINTFLGLKCRLFAILVLINAAFLGSQLMFDGKFDVIPARNLI
jgi:hypothetical protein